MDEGFLAQRRGVTGERGRAADEVVAGVERLP